MSTELLIYVPSRCEQAGSSAFYAVLILAVSATLPSRFTITLYSGPLTEPEASEQPSTRPFPFFGDNKHAGLFYVLPLTRHAREIGRICPAVGGLHSRTTCTAHQKSTTVSDFL